MQLVRTQSNRSESEARTSLQEPDTMRPAFR